RVAVNLAPVSLVDPRLVEDVAAALRRHGVEPARLTLELTETAVLDCARAWKRQQGCR
ncbi:MAG: hypothetical protein QOF29_159, partial [bacterium]